MKLKGPFTVKIRRCRPELLDVAGRHLARAQWSSFGVPSDDVDTMERIAAALNREEARKATEAADEREKRRIVAVYGPKRRTAKKGEPKR